MMSVVDLRTEPVGRDEIRARLKRLRPGEVLTVIHGEDPQPLVEELKSSTSGRWDVQKMHRTRTDGAWVVYVKRTRGGST